MGYPDLVERLGIFVDPGNDSHAHMASIDQESALYAAPLAVQLEAAQLANRIGLSKVPGVIFLAGPIFPALWTLPGKPRILIPIELWENLDPRQRQALLAHELAHLRRRDHCVRLLETICTILWWWHPVVWMARRQIHDFEEQCCDAWVLWALPQSARSYGMALLATVDFVSTYRPVRPALVAGLGEFAHLKRRLLMLKQGSVARKLSRTALLAMCGVASAALGVGPVFAQEAPAADPTAAQRQEDLARLNAAEAHVMELNEARAQLEHARAKLEKAQAEFQQAQNRMNAIAGIPQAPQPAIVGVAPSGNSDPNNPYVRWYIRANGPDQPVIIAREPVAPMGIGSAAIGQPGAPSALPPNPGEMGSVSISPSGTMAITPPTSRLMPPASLRPSGDQNARLDQLERQMQQMMDELKLLERRSAGRAGVQGRIAPPQPTTPREPGLQYKAAPPRVGGSAGPSPTPHTPASSESQSPPSTPDAPATR